MIVLELIVTFVDTIPNRSKMSGQFQNQGVQSVCTGTIISQALTVYNLLDPGPWIKKMTGESVHTCELLPV